MLSVARAMVALSLAATDALPERISVTQLSRSPCSPPGRVRTSRRSRPHWDCRVSATSRLSDRLVVAGWVCREVSSHTRREIVLNLTDVGRNLLGASDRHRIATLTGALEQLPAARRATIVTALCDFAEAARPGGTGRARS